MSFICTSAFESFHFRLMPLSDHTRALSMCARRPAYWLFSDDAQVFVTAIPILIVFRSRMLPLQSTCAWNRELSQKGQQSGKCDSAAFSATVATHADNSLSFIFSLQILIQGRSQRYSSFIQTENRGNTCNMCHICIYCSVPWDDGAHVVIWRYTNWMELNRTQLNIELNWINEITM